MLRRATLEMLVVATLAVAPGGVSHAQLFLLYDWTSAAGGNYASQFNWNPIGVPDSSSEIARFQLNAIYSVLVPANYTVGSLAAREQGNVTLNLQGTTYTTGQLSVDPTVGGIVSLALTAGIVSVSGNTYVGRNASSGKANLILASASLTTVDALVGEGANSAGHVTIGQTSNWTAGGPVILGGAGDAQLDINAGFVTTCLGMNCNSAPTRGTATHARVVMAQRGQSTAAATIFGTWNTGDLIVGDAGGAELSVLATHLSTSQGINVSSAGALTSKSVSVGAQAGSSGIVEIIGSAVGPGFTILTSEWKVTGSLALGGTNGAPGGDGSLIIGPLNVVSVGSDLKIWPGGTVVVNENGVLSVSGAANLGGTLKFLLVGTTNPQLGNKFEILSATTGVAGTFDSVDFPMLDSGLTWAVNYGATSVFLEVVEGLPGDYNQNGIVDAADYVVWRNTLGSMTDLRADGNGNNEIDAGDYDVWRAQFGRTVGSGAGDLPYQTTVPEPAGLVLLATAALARVLTRCGRDDQIIAAIWH